MPVNRYTARLLVGDANRIITRFGPTASIYLHKGGVRTTTIEAAATMIRGMLRSNRHSEKLLTLAESSAWGRCAKFRFGAEATYTAACDALWFFRSSSARSQSTSGEPMGQPLAIQYACARAWIMSWSEFAAAGFSVAPSVSI